MDYSRFYKDEESEKEKNKITPGSVFQTILQNTTKAGLGLADLINRFGSRFSDPSGLSPISRGVPEFSRELGYGIAGASELEKEKGMPEGLPQKLISSASQMAVDIPTKYMNPAWAGIMVGEKMLGGADKGKTAEDIAAQIESGGGGGIPRDEGGILTKLKDVAVGGLSGAKDVALLKGLGKLGELVPGVARSLVEGAGFGGMAALEGGSVDDIISNAIIGGYFGFKKRKAPQKTISEFKNDISKALGRKLTPKEIIKVTETAKVELEKPQEQLETAPKQPQIAPQSTISNPRGEVVEPKIKILPELKLPPTFKQNEVIPPEISKPPSAEEGGFGKKITPGRNFTVRTDKNNKLIESGTGGDEGRAKLDYSKNEKLYELKPEDNNWYDVTSGPAQKISDSKLIKYLNDKKIGGGGEEETIPEYIISQESPSAQPPKEITLQKPYEPIMKESGPAKDTWVAAVEDGLANPENPWDIPKYESVNKKEFAERSVGLVSSNPDAAWSVLNEGAEPPPGTSKASVFLAMKHMVDSSGNVELLRRFSQSKVNVKISEAGSLLGTISGYKAEETPTGAFNAIEKTRKKAIEELKESPLAGNIFEKRLNTAKQNLDDAIKRQNQDIARLAIIWRQKKQNQYAKKLGKKELALTEKIKAGDFKDDPKYKTWIDKQTGGLKNKVNQLQKTYNKLKDIADRRETGITDEEAKNIMNLYDRVQQTKADMESGRDRMVYGRAYVDFHEYINDLKFAAIKPTIREAIRMPFKMAVKAGGISKAIKAAFDNSYIFRQGFKTMASHPKIWLENSAKSFRWAVQQFGGKHVMRELMADIVSRPNYSIIEKMGKNGKFFGNPEEPFPTSIPEKIWFFGKLYKASETAFVGQAYKTRADLADKFIEMADRFKPNPTLQKLFPNTDFGINIRDKKSLESIGKLIGSLTGRGDIGTWGERKGELINNVFFSARFFKSNLDFLTAHQFQKGVTPFVRVEAAKNLVKAIGVTAAILTIAKALKPGSVDDDPRSANFGKIKIGNTRFDVTGGMGSIVTLASRLMLGSTKSSTSGNVTELNTGGYGKPTGKDIIQEFIDGKLAPASSVIWNSLLGGRDKLTRGKPTIVSTLKNLTYPMPVQNLEELLQDPESANIVMSMIADGLGIGVNTYGGKISLTKKQDNKDYSMFFK